MNVKSANALTTQYNVDLVIIGASIAGCATAILFAQRGLKVALVEQHSSPQSYKKVCTHYLQPESVPFFQELGVWDAMIAAGAVPSYMTARTPWGKVNFPHLGRQQGLNLRREKLDPILRNKASSYKNVQTFTGFRLDELIRENDGMLLDEQVRGVKVKRGAEVIHILAPLVVGADGRRSKTAELAGVKSRQSANQRFSHFAFYKGLPDRYEGNTQVWLVNNGESYAAAFPNDNELTLISAYVANKYQADWQHHVEQKFEDYIRTLPDGPRIDQAQRVSPVYGMKKADSVLRDAAVPGLALVGDAALAVDPLSGMGITLALESAFMLAHELEGTLPVMGQKDIAQLNRALSHYACHHHAKFGLAYLFLSRFSKAKPFHPATRFLLWSTVKILGQRLAHWEQSSRKYRLPFLLFR